MMGEIPALEPQVTLLLPWELGDGREYSQGSKMARKMEMARNTLRGGRGAYLCNTIWPKWQIIWTIFKATTRKK